MGTINSIGPKATVWMLVWRSAFSPSTPKIRVRIQLAACIFCTKRQNKGLKRPGLAHLKKTFNLSLFSIKDLGLNIGTGENWLTYLRNGVEGVPPDHHRVASSGRRSHRDGFVDIVQVPFEGHRRRIWVEADADGGSVTDAEVFVDQLFQRSRLSWKYI